MTVQTSFETVFEWYYCELVAPVGELAQLDKAVAIMRGKGFAWPDRGPCSDGEFVPIRGRTGEKCLLARLCQPRIR